MRPLFKDPQAWEQADLLMQPALIRVIDNLRKALEDSTLMGTYQEVQDPYPGHQLLLSSSHQTMIVDIWNLCFQVCFLEYHSPFAGASEQELAQTVDIDTSLLTSEGTVDWIARDQKVKHLVQAIFQAFPQETP